MKPDNKNEKVNCRLNTSNVLSQKSA